MSEKTCSKCRVTRPLDDFPLRPGTPDGHRGVCLPCKRAVFKQQYADKHPDAPGRRIGRPRKINPERTEKACSKCGVIKPIDDFHRSAGAPDGRQSRCRDCIAASRGVVPERRGKVGPKPASTDPRRNLRAWLKQQYGMTLDEYDALNEQQGGLCAVCEQPCSRNARLSVDHDHETGKIRGLLCDRCNKTLGLLRDDPRVVDCAIAYLTASLDEEPRRAV